MEKEEVLRRIGEEKLIAVIRLEVGLDEVIAACEAVLAGGVAAIEITCSVPDALEVVRALAAREGRSFLVGAGTVLDADTAAAMAGAGAEFIVSPAVIAEVVEESRRRGVVAIPGAFTPTEIWSAHSLGADAVKVFPAARLGPGYLKELAAPLPGVRLIPTGGVNLGNVGEFIDAGAFAVGVGGELVNRDAVARGAWGELTAQAARFALAVRDALS